MKILLRLSRVSNNLENNIIMVFHYLKVAIRSLLKYRTQNIISILGIAVGFVCFAFSMIWIRYELSYDTFHRDSDRMYVVRSWIH